MVQTLRFRTLYVLFFISHGRRQPLHVQVTAHPTAAWVWRQLIEATALGRQPSYLIHEHDRVYGADFATRAAAIGIKSLKTPVQAPNANSVGERVVRTFRRECLDHLLILGELSGGKRHEGVRECTRSRDRRRAVCGRTACTVR